MYYVLYMLLLVDREVPKIMPRLSLKPLNAFSFDPNYAPATKCKTTDAYTASYFISTLGSNF
jgi:hypothetical protein